MRMRTALAFLAGWMGLLAVAPAVKAQAVLFDGIGPGKGKATALLAPAEVTADDYSVFGRLEFGATDYLNFFGQLGGRFNGDDTALPGLGWSATLVRQGDRLPFTIALFNSALFPLEGGAAPDALITVAPVFSYRFGEEEDTGATLYGGPVAVFKVNSPGGNDVNALFGVKVRRIAERWDFLAELQGGEKSRFAVGFQFRFSE